MPEFVVILELRHKIRKASTDDEMILSVSVAIVAHFSHRFDRTKWKSSFRAVPGASFLSRGSN